MITKIDLASVNRASCLMVIPFIDEAHIECLSNKFRTSGSLMLDVVDEIGVSNPGVYYFENADGFRQVVWIRVKDEKCMRNSFGEVMRLWMIRFGIMPEIMVYVPEGIEIGFLMPYSKRYEFSFLEGRYYYDGKGNDYSGDKRGSPGPLG